VHGRHRRAKRLLFRSAVGACTLLARALPRSAALETFAAIGAAAGRIDRPAFRRAIDHLEIAYASATSDADRRRLARAMFRDLGRNVVDLLRLERMRPAALRDLVALEGLEHLDAALSRGRGVMALSAHLGNWELLGAALVAHGYPVHVIARPLFDTPSDRTLNDWRRGAGLVVHTSENALLSAARALRNGEVVGVLLDQDTRGEGIFVEFFGRPAHVPTAPIALARRLGAAIVPMVIGLERSGAHRARVFPAIEAGASKTCASMTERVALEQVIAQWHRILEREISRRPTQWPWFHRRWKKRPASVAAREARRARLPRIVRGPAAPSREAAITR
jgi:KDO2-lipid IV(A) lauroyltransferase